MTTRPAERLVGERVVVRRYRLDDAPALVRAVTESVDHLRPWMPWIAAEPQTVEQRGEHIRAWNAQWDAGEQFVVVLVDPADDTRVIGGAGLHQRGGPHEIEIGYWVHVDWTGRGIATETSRLLTTAGLALDGKTDVVICHDRANVASGAVPRRLGFNLVEEASRDRDAPGQVGIFCTWRMTSAQWTDAALV